MPSRPWWWRERRGDVALGFTRREGGSSTGQWSGLNLGSHVGDDAAAVASNRAAVRHALAELSGVDAAGLRPVFMNQVHGAQVRTITDSDRIDRIDQVDQIDQVAECDGVVTNLPGTALFVLVADCAPVLLHDAAAGVIGAAHAGRPGMLAGVVPATIAAMRDLGAHDIRAVVGPSVCGRCYEVPETMRADAVAIEPVSGAVTWQGTPAIDVATGVVEQLRREGAEVTWVGGCTREEPALYSHRRDGQTGRLGGVIARSEGAGHADAGGGHR